MADEVYEGAIGIDLGMTLLLVSQSYETIVLELILSRNNLQLCRQLCWEPSRDQ